MKERPILFSGPMVRALLDGRKTQTRRIVKPQPVIATWRDATNCPYGAPGDRLWVRETHALAAPSLSGRLEYAGARLAESDYGPVEIWYRADGALGVMSMLFADGPRWRPSIHMPRWASRLTLEVTGVRVERLQDISEADASAEGCGVMPDVVTVTARDEFAALWESIHGTEAWAANPWVWVVEFQKVGET